MQLYYKFSEYLKKKFGSRVYKIGIDANFSCPNRDGKLSTEGCIFCDNRAFCVNTRISPKKSIEQQIEDGMNFGKNKFKAEKFIVYFQAYTNTYGPVELLKEKYDIVKKYKNVVGIAIGTRPDCVDDTVLDLIESYSNDYEVWLEYGLQSIHEKTLKLINRNHTYQQFLDAIEMTKKRDIKICAHVIIGLPEETETEIIEIAKEINRLNLNAVKIHPLHIIKETKLETMYLEGRYKPLSLDEFVELAIKFLEHLHSDIIIQRITADCPPQYLIGPEWILNKKIVLNEIDKRMKERRTWQGRLT